MLVVYVWLGDHDLHVWMGGHDLYVWGGGRSQLQSSSRMQLQINRNLATFTRMVISEMKQEILKMNLTYFTEINTKSATNWIKLPQNCFSESWLADIPNLLGRVRVMV